MLFENCVTSSQPNDSLVLEKFLFSKVLYFWKNRSARSAQNLDHFLKNQFVDFLKKWSRGKGLILLGKIKQNKLFSAPAIGRERNQCLIFLIWEKFNYLWRIFFQRSIKSSLKKFKIPIHLSLILLASLD